VGEVRQDAQLVLPQALGDDYGDVRGVGGARSPQQLDVGLPWVVEDVDAGVDLRGEVDGLVAQLRRRVEDHVRVQPGGEVGGVEEAGGVAVERGGLIVDAQRDNDPLEALTDRAALEAGHERAGGVGDAVQEAGEGHVISTETSEVRGDQRPSAASRKQAHRATASRPSRAQSGTTMLSPPGTATIARSSSAGE
jgi:hypothetical protein